MSVIVALALAIALLAPAPSASAHVSSYCGHGSIQETAEGSLWLVEYWTHENVMELGQRVHYHHYVHHFFNGIWGWVPLHSVKKHCGTWH